MYNNTCSKCGKEFETKNPKRVICSDCLYSDNKEKKTTQENLKYANEAPSAGESGSGGQRSEDGERSGGYRKPGYQGNRSYDQNRQGGRPDGGGRFEGRPGGRPDGGGRFEGRQGGRPGGGGGRFEGRQGGRPGGGGGGYKQRPKAPPKKLLISKEQLIEIEKLYVPHLPLPNPDIHEVIGEKLELEPSKVFFGINLIRQKRKLPKLLYPKRKLALTMEQLNAIWKLYEPLLPTPPVGCHKFISKQVNIDEWRVHVGIGVLRKQHNLPRWNVTEEEAAEMEAAEKKAAEMEAAAATDEIKMVSEAVDSSEQDDESVSASLDKD